jgi:UDP-N-acetylmuramoylalanine--D-glutamate ligase
MIMENWQKKSILIIGAARQGLATARFLSRNGARVILNDKRLPDQMRKAIEAMQDIPVEWALGHHDLELLDRVDLVCLSGGVPLTLPIVQETIRRGIPLSNDTKIFMEAVPCRTIGITGSAGKTTTTTLVGRMAQDAVKKPSNVWIGGNIGLPLVEYLGEIKPDDTVILEVSSFQLEQMTLVPNISAILNVTPNHLDRHGTFEAYLEAKARMVDFQKKNSLTVLNREDAGSWGMANRVQGKLVTFGIGELAPGQLGTYFKNNKLYLETENAKQEIMPVSDIHLRGKHNLQNVLAACAIAYAAGFPVSSMLAGVQDFKGVPHRLEFVRNINGSNWYNDSIATTPERTMAAIRSFEEPLVLMLGGRDKNLPWEDLASMIHQRVDHVVVFGEAAEKILKALGNVQNGSRPYTIDRCQNLKGAIEAAARVSEPGDVILLSPGGTSFDEFNDFEERGEVFRKWVNQL